MYTYTNWDKCYDGEVPGVLREHLTSKPGHELGRAWEGQLQEPGKQRIACVNSPNDSAWNTRDKGRQWTRRQREWWRRWAERPPRVGQAVSAGCGWDLGLGLTKVCSHDSAWSRGGARRALRKGSREWPFQGSLILNNSNSLIYFRKKLIYWKQIL